MPASSHTENFGDLREIETFPFRFISSFHLVCGFEDTKPASSKVVDRQYLLMASSSEQYVLQMLSGRARDERRRQIETA